MQTLHVYSPAVLEHVVHLAVGRDARWGVATHHQNSVVQNSDAEVTACHLHWCNHLPRSGPRVEALHNLLAHPAGGTT